jgi:hypothetical protein
VNYLVSASFGKINPDPCHMCATWLAGFALPGSARRHASTVERFQSFVTPMTASGVGNCPRATYAVTVDGLTPKYAAIFLVVM